MYVLLFATWIQKQVCLDRFWFFWTVNTVTCGFKFDVLIWKLRAMTWFAANHWTFKFIHISFNRLLRISMLSLLPSWIPYVDKFQHRFFTSSLLLTVNLSKEILVSNLVAPLLYIRHLLKCCSRLHGVDYTSLTVDSFLCGLCSTTMS